MKNIIIICVCVLFYQPIAMCFHIVGDIILTVGKFLTSFF